MPHEPNRSSLAGAILLWTLRIVAAAVLAAGGSAGLCLAAPAVGERFIARARVVKPGKSQVFTACELFALEGGSEKLVATGETLLSVVAGEGA